MMKLYQPPYWPDSGDDRKIKEWTLCLGSVAIIPRHTRPPAQSFIPFEHTELQFRNSEANHHKHCEGILMLTGIFLILFQSHLKSKVKTALTVVTHKI